MESSIINSSLTTGIVSVALIACVTLVITSCAACTRFLRKRKEKKKENEKDPEKAEIALEEQDGAGGKGKENGVTNVAFEPATDGTTKAEEEKPIQELKAEVQAGENETAQKNPENSSRVENGNSILERTTESEQKTGPPIDQTPEPITRPNLECQLSGGSDDAFMPDQEDSEGAVKKQTSVVEIDREKATHFSLHTSAVDDFDIVTSNNSVKPTHADIQESAPPTLSTCPEEQGEEEGEKEGEEKEENSFKEAGDLSRFDDILIRGGWRRSVKLRDLVDLNLLTSSKADEVKETMAELGDVEDKPVPDALKPFLCGTSPVAGIMISESGEKKSIYSSAKDGIIRRGTAISLLEAQAATGNIIDPITGRQMSVSEAFQLGLLDKVYETVVSRAERAVTGYKSRVSPDVLSLGQAMERGLVIESHGIRLLEAQLATGGIIDHKTNIRLPLDVAVEQGLLDQKVADIVKAACTDAAMDDVEDSLKTFFDPNTEENVTYSELMKRSVVDTDTGLRLYPLEKIGRKRYSYGSHSGRSSLASSRASSKESIPAAVAAASSP